jgi:histidyl-tRNA synthetase
MDKQNDYALENQIPFVVYIGEDEIKENKVELKCLANRKKVFISRDDLISELNILRNDPELLNVQKPIKK